MNLQPVARHHRRYPGQDVCDGFGHARMVERTIGRRVGTGGSSGVDYLDEAAGVRVFTDLWAVRSILLARDQLPGLDNPDFYGFAT